MNNVLIGQGAEADYRESLRWYTERSNLAAEGFEAAFSRALEAIVENPEWYPTCDDRHRYYMMKRYPFQVIYRSTSDGRLLVVAVAHTSRQPGYWSGR